MPQDENRHTPVTNVLIALGSNVTSSHGGPQATVAAALNELDAAPLRLIAQSRSYRTPCFPAGAGPDYVNAVAQVETALAPQSLLAHLHAIEAAFERTRVARWGARTLDLDILDHGGAVLPDLETWRRWADLPVVEQMRDIPAGLILPHPRIQDRGFVLVPLAEVAPAWQHPVLHRSAADLRDLLTPKDLSGIWPLVET